MIKVIKVDKNLSEIKNLINLQIIHAKRNVASSDSNKKPISIITGQYFHHIDKANELAFQDVEKEISDIDKCLTEKYQPVFKEFLEKSQRCS